LSPFFNYTKTVGGLLPSRVYQALDTPNTLKVS
jgi:hypothetical protein